MSASSDDHRILVKRSKKLEKILGEMPPSELILPIPNNDTRSFAPRMVDGDEKRKTPPRSKSRGRSLKTWWNDKSSLKLESPQPPSTVPPIPRPSSSTDSILSTSSYEGSFVPTKVTLPLDSTQPPKVMRVDFHHHPRSPSFIPSTPVLKARPGIKRGDSVISYFSLSIGASTPTSPADRSPTPTPERERKRKVQNVSKLSRTLGECPKKLLDGVTSKSAAAEPLETRVMIRQESRSLELASRGGKELAPVSERHVMSDTEVTGRARPPSHLTRTRMGWVRDRGSKYYVEEDYEVIRNTLRMLR